MKFKHPAENAVLLGDDAASQSTIQSSVAAAAALGATGTPSRGGTAVIPVRKKSRQDNLAEITFRMDHEKRINEKHWLEMWSITSRELREVRKELKSEDDEDVVRELEGDVRVLRKRKADYAEMLGLKDDVVTDNV